MRAPRVIVWKSLIKSFAGAHLSRLITTLALAPASSKWLYGYLGRRALITLTALLYPARLLLQIAGDSFEGEVLRARLILTDEDLRLTLVLERATTRIASSDFLLPIELIVSRARRARVRWEKWYTQWVNFEEEEVSWRGHQIRLFLR